MELTKSELEIMDLLWASEQPLSRADFIGKSYEKSWKDSSVHILLNGLLRKKAIREAGFIKCGKTFGRTFEPTLTREQYYATTIFSHKHKPNIVGLIGSLLTRKDITREELEQISQLVQKRKEK